MLRISLVMMGVLGLVNQSFGQTIGYGAKGAEIAEMKCDLSKAIAPSAQTQKLVGTKGVTYGCAYQRQFHEATFVGVDFNLAAAKTAGSSLVLSVKCNAGNPVGVYAFGGYPVGYQTSTSAVTPFFYNPNPKMPGSRCFITGDAVLAKQLKATINKSAMVILPRSIIQ
jgi:hypothetical protein